ncbi:hypothetical protein GY21_07490 [Cryobacterium roopkundense]|uniref:Uncharacterized protein n=1 Tax=Cryobacterium roopkundense TaxID=1001240 RepID=A0A099JJ83_9MICO|nr:hypothetical protein [Cryobacterium roopkundense]KGJ77538.1 hypothetical protein GY21_07490 [Cryobacterium roopkundense]MBB5640737.1 hypothetical protein [Cryobacterium roopkundense]
MAITVLETPARSFRWWLSEEEVGHHLAHHRGWRLADNGSVMAGKVVKKRIAGSLAELGTAALASGWALRASAARSDGSGPTHFMWGVFDARSDAEIAAQVKLTATRDSPEPLTPRA